MLFICATPIGNLQDITLRAISILSTVDIILCEDTRKSKQLLSAHQISYKRLIALHEHNENEITQKVLTWLNEGLNICQISDAGTPGISDPGARLCKQVLAYGHKISPLPGACAYTSLLSIAGLHGANLFYGFLPSLTTARKNILAKWEFVEYAVCIYESPHRIIDCLTDIVATLGKRNVLMGRELTKQFETVVKLPANELLEFVKSDHNQQRGEFVLLIYPEDIDLDLEPAQHLTEEQITTLKLLLPELPPKKAVTIAHKITGADKTLLYDLAIKLNQKK